MMAYKYEPRSAMGSRSAALFPRANPASGENETTSILSTARILRSWGILNSKTKCEASFPPSLFQGPS